jgi:CheY-like chemotaxis protein
MYGLVFSRRDHEMVEVEDGRTALAALQPFDIILLDLRMPGWTASVSSARFERHRSPERSRPS